MPELFFYNLGNSTVYILFVFFWFYFRVFLRGKLKIPLLQYCQTSSWRVGRIIKLVNCLVDTRGNFGLSY